MISDFLDKEFQIKNPKSEIEEPINAVKYDAFLFGGPYLSVES
jgi:hypothetical protein